MAKKKNIENKKKEEYKQLYRSKKNKVIAGGCGGIAEYFKIDPVIIRLILVVLLLGYGVGFIAYLLAWIIIPLEK